MSKENPKSIIKHSSIRYVSKMGTFSDIRTSLFPRAAQKIFTQTQIIYVSSEDITWFLNLTLGSVI